MKKIIMLDDAMINKIAAGEVVDRPGSVVKELVENAIDSGATRIVIETAGGGIDMIRISDNGFGIAEDDVCSAFTRHATSKIRNMDDLENVLTLGFRGEGLSSIAAVSQVELITKTAAAAVAKQVEIHGGKVVSESHIGANQGTTVIMRNLFYNTPARRKFLKKPASESAHISDIVQRIVLARPNISFTYIVNGSQNIITADDGNLQTAALAVYGREIAANLFPISESVLGLEISGLIGKPEISRGNRSYGSIFVNGRYVKSKVLETAIGEAYKNRLTVGKFPVYMLNLNLDPAKVDVNVHPQKLEVRFYDESYIYKALSEAVAKGLKNEILIPGVKIKPVAEYDKQEEIESSQTTILSKPDNSPDYKEKDSAYSVNMASVISALYGSQNDGLLFVKEAAAVKSSYNYYENNPSDVDLSESEAPGVNKVANLNRELFFSNYNIIGQFLSTYWLVEQGDTIFMIDQHAAHERVLFEKLLREYKESKTISQKLIDPIIIKLSDKEAAILKDNEEMFLRFGYEIEPVIANEYAIKTLPFILRGATDISLFMQILDKLSDNENSVSDIYEERLEAIANVSCKAAVKANDRLHRAEAKGLIEELLKLDNPFSCPHGRPTIVKLTKYEIEKMFKRIL